MSNRFVYRLNFVSNDFCIDYMYIICILLSLLVFHIIRIVKLIFIY